MTCAMTKKKGEVIYPAEWLNRTGLEDQIFADEPFPGVGLRTDDLDIPPYSSFFKSAPKALPPDGAGGLDSPPVVQPAPIYDCTKRFESFVGVCAIVVSFLALLILSWLVGP